MTYDEWKLAAPDDEPDRVAETEELERLKEELADSMEDDWRGP